MFDNLNNDVPAIYRLWVDNQLNLQIALSSFAIGKIKELGNSMGTWRQKETGGALDFVPLGNEMTPWGFDSCLQPLNIPGNGLAFTITLPRPLIKMPVGERFGRRNHQAWREIEMIGRTIQLIFDCLRFEYPPDSLREDMDRHLLHITAFGPTGEDGLWPMGAAFSPRLTQWLNEASATDQLAGILLSVRQAMHHMHHVLMPLEIPEDIYFFRCEYNAEYGSAMFEVPGSACQLYSDSRETGLTAGIALHPHNIDSPIQAFTFLAGLAKLEMLAVEHGCT